MLFSQRIGKQAAQKLVQKDSIDIDLRNSLWNALILCYWDRYHDVSPRHRNIRGSNLELLVYRLWLYFFKTPIDTLDPSFDKALKTLRSYFYEAEWHEVYTLVEYVAWNGPEEWESEFIETVNDYLARENAAYRFVHGQITEITSEAEIEAVESAMDQSAPYFGARTHLEAALRLLSDRENPDYRNSIKESISAVESLAKAISGEDKATLGAALRVLEKDISLHPALKSAFSSLYGYTSDAGGIRHALLEEDNLTKTDAKFMLVSCSAFINYVVGPAKFSYVPRRPKRGMQKERRRGWFAGSNPQGPS